MTAATLAGSAKPGSGLRPVNPRQDLGQLADLIEVAFAGNLDLVGRRMVREMRTVGQWGWLGWMFGHLLLPPAARPMGYVWVEDGRLVGNASLLPVRNYPDRWVMANVAVHPDFRRRGIGRQLVQASEQLAWDGGARTLVLQVEPGNRAASELYARLDFTHWGTRSSWRRLGGDSLREPADPNRIRRSQGHDWRAHLALARAVSPGGVIWPFPLSERMFRNRRGVQHWLYWSGESLLGGLSVRQGPLLRLTMLVEPSVQGQIEYQLLRCGLQQARPDQTVLLQDYPVDTAAEALRALGFHERRALAWMAKDYLEGDRR